MVGRQALITPNDGSSILQQTPCEAVYVKSVWSQLLSQSIRLREITHMLEQSQWFQDLLKSQGPNSHVPKAEHSSQPNSFGYGKMQAP